MFKHYKTMTEEYLHYLWRFQALKPGHWQSTKSKSIRVLDPGFHNTDSGPDFSNARIEIDGQIWAGSVEIHLRSSDWNRHRHQYDEAYNNVILHVVYEADQTVFCTNNYSPPCFEIKGLFDPQLYWRFEQLMQSKMAIPCANSFLSAPEIAKQAMLSRCAVERLEHMSEKLARLYGKYSGDWYSLVYEKLAVSLLGKANAEPAETLCEILPIGLLRKIEKPDSRLAFFLGASGLLSNLDRQCGAWLSEYKYLLKKYPIEAMNKLQWKYSRMRPLAFPDRRIALLSSLIPSALNWMNSIYSGDSNLIGDWPKLSDYWASHYRLGKKASSSLSLTISLSLQDRIKINVLAPILFFYGRKTAQPEFQDRAQEIWDELPVESNRIVNIYEQLGLSMRSALDSQALIAWYRHYCQPKKCLTCTLGKELLNRNE